MAKLRIRVGDREYAFDDSQTVTIGRQSDSLVPLSDALVSRRHAEIRADAQGWVYRDVGSRNGTYQNGTPIQEVRIFGPLDLRLGDDGTGVVVHLEPEHLGETQPRRPVELVAEEAQPASDGASGATDGAVATAAELPADGATEAAGHPLAAFGEASFVYRPSMTMSRIGRAPDNDIVINDLLVSRHHAELHRESGSYILVDLDSDNGTFVNGKRISGHAGITETDFITIGHYLFRLVGGALEEYIDTGEISFEALDLVVRTSSGGILLDDVSFSLDRQGFLAVVGPSGAGKSTLLNALTGFRPADDGRVLYNDRDLYEDYDDLRQRIGFVPQDDVLHPQLTVRRALEFAAALRFPTDTGAEERKKRVQEVMGELGLAERADLPIRQLSGGQRKRASIALELLTRPSLLFLDEPTSGLDPGYEKAIMTLLRELADGGRTVVVVTHSVQSLDLCDRVLFLAPGGKVAYFGPPKQALEYFGEHDYADIFSRLDRERETDWKSRFRRHPFYDAYVRQPLIGHDIALSESGPAQTLPPPPRQSWLPQFKTLTQRYIAVLASDRRNLMVLLLQAPILGVLILLISPPHSFDPSPTANHSQSITVALMIVLAVTFMGAANAIREIVKELPIYRRERSVGLSISAYIASKVAVLSVLTAVQALVLLALAVMRQHGPQASASGLPPVLELYLDVVIAGIAAMAVSLLISTAVTASDKAMTLLPLLLIPQIILSGGIISLEDKPGMSQLSDIVTANWGFSATASTIDLNFLINPGHPELALDGKPADGSWRRARQVWTRDIAALVLLGAGSLAAALMLLRRRDPFVVRAGPLTAVVGDLLKRSGVQRSAKDFAKESAQRVVRDGVWLALYGVIHFLLR